MAKKKVRARAASKLNGGKGNKKTVLEDLVKRFGVPRWKLAVMPKSDLLKVADKGKQEVLAAADKSGAAHTAKYHGKRKEAKG